MKRLVLRWGRSSYETDSDLKRERAAALGLGLDWRLDVGKQPDLRGVDVLVVVSGVRVDRAVIAQFTGDLIVATTSGVDHIDVASCQEFGKTLVRCAEARRDAVVEQAIGQLVTLMRGFPALEAAARGGEWARAQLPQLAPRPIQGSSIVVVGQGVIGIRASEVLRGMGARVFGVDPLLPEAPRLEDVLPGADAVTLHCSLTESSRNLLSRERLALLPSHAVMVNTARGDVLDLEAALERVKSGRLRGLAVDVFPEEPWPGLAEAAAIPGVLLTPHSAGFVVDLGRKVAEGVGKALAAWKNGEVPAYRVC